MHDWNITILTISCAAMWYFIYSKLRSIGSGIRDRKHQESSFIIRVSLNLEKILCLPHFARDNMLLSKFNGLYNNSNIDQNWHSVVFAIKNDLIFVNGCLRPYVGHTISIPDESKPKQPFEIIVGFEDSNLVVYYEPDALSRAYVACLPLAYVAYRYNYHPRFLTQISSIENAPEHGTREKDPQLKADYDRLRMSIVDGKLHKGLEAKFAALGNQLLKENGFQRIGNEQDIRRSDLYRNENAGVAVEISPLDHGL